MYNVEQDDLFIFEFDPEPGADLMGVNLYSLAAVDKTTGKYIEDYDPVKSR